MANWDAAVMAMIGVSCAGFLLSQGERQRVRWIGAMRRCILRLSGVIRYEQPPLETLLRRIELRANLQEREMTRILHACAEGLQRSADLPLLFAGESARVSGYGVLSAEDRGAFEMVIGELGQLRLDEQLRLLSDADERLRQREAVLTRECARRSRLIQTLGLAGGAAMFLILI